MYENKFDDIKKGLECHAGTKYMCVCNDCPYSLNDICHYALAEDALNLLREQQEKIKLLESIICKN